MYNCFTNYWVCKFPITCLSNLGYCTEKRTHNLKSLLLNMSREPKKAKMTESLQKARSKLKEKGQKYVPGTVTLKVLGSGARGAPRSLYVFTDQSRYLFNCGEGTQRLAHEHKMRLSKLEQIFVTYPSWENMGGLPGIALTIQDVGVPEITLHGPDGLEDIFPATKRFVILKDLSVKMASCLRGSCFEDSVMKVEYVPLHSKQPNLTDDKVDTSSDSDDNIDYYQHLKRKKPTEERGTSKRLKSNYGISMAYICKLQDRPGSLCLEKCVDNKVPPGPLLGLLKAGKDVTLADGTVVKAADVCLPNEPGPKFIIVDCPTADYVDSLVMEERFQQEAEGTVQLVVHFTPRDVSQDKRYLHWMQRFSSETQHLMLNDLNECQGSIAVHRIQYKLNLLHPNIFPLLHLPSQDDESLVKTLCSYHLRPLKGLDRTEELTINPSLYTQETLDVPLFSESLVSLQRQMTALQAQHVSHAKFPNIVFLGTGSCIPNKTRNTSGILLNVDEDCSILLDCGEGTLGQLVRFYGRDVDKVLRNLRAIYVSHLHADHHIGLIGVLKARRQALKESHQAEPVFVIAPKQIKSWLSFYHHNFEPISNDFIRLDNGSLYLGDHKMAPELEGRLMARLGLKNVNTVLVEHCPNAFGVAFVHDKWKISYSGDTMPCEAFVKLGVNSDLLIHEATMEDELEDEAKLKLHSTTSQAIEIGRRMKAKFTLLTHFSQRYAKLPRLNDNIVADNVGIAFDNMQISLDQLPILPLLYPALKLMFADHHEELELKSVRRNLKKEREKLSATGT